MIGPGEVTAVLVTRGDQPKMMERIKDLLIFEKLVVWDNSELPDWKTAGRYAGATRARTEWVYFQDDDVIVPQDTQEKLCYMYAGEECLANYGHGENDGGYGDLPLVCGGAIVNWRAAWFRIMEYAAHHSLDEGFMYEADFVVGVLYKVWQHVHLPFEIEMPVAQHESRLVNQPWQKGLKLEITNRARAIRDAR